MTSVQRKAVGFLLFEYGSASMKYTKGNHELLRRTLAGEEHADHYQPTPECRDALAKVLAGDWSPLSPRQRVIIEAEQAEYDRMKPATGENE